MNIPLNINWQQILLHLLNFAILAGGLHFLLYKPVKKFMEQRNQHYLDLENEAEQLRCEAEELREEREAQLRDVETEIREKRLQAQTDLRKMEEQQMEDAEKAAAAVMDEARKAAERYREKTLRESRKELQDLAVLAAGKLIVDPNADAIDQFLNAAEKENVDGTAGM